MIRVTSHGEQVLFDNAPTGDLLLTVHRALIEKPRSCGWEMKETEDGFQLRLRQPQVIHVHLEIGG